MKPTPTSSTHAATPSGPRSIFTPNASSTSALPHALDAARLPCFATRASAAAATIAESVEMLMLFERSPPVPTTSMAPSVTATRTACRRITDAKPAISAGVSPRIRSAVTSAASCAGVASPDMIEVIADSASARVSVRPSMTAPSASRASKEVLQHLETVGGEHRLGMELHRFKRQRRVAQTHDDAVVRPGRHDELGRQRLLVDHERVIAGRDGPLWHSEEQTLAVVRDEAGLSVARLGSADDAGAERDRGALEAEADAERR